MMTANREPITELPRNTVVAYHGGGYDGCFWEWNFAFIDGDGEFHDIYSSGYFGVHNADDLLDKLNDRDDHDLYNVSDPAEIERMVDAESVTNAGRLAAFFAENDEFGVKVMLKCDQCGERVELEGCHAEDIFCGGGIHLEAGKIICPDCHSSHSCWHCGEFYEGELVNEIETEDGKTIELNGSACEWCADDFKSGRREPE